MTYKNLVKTIMGFSDYIDMDSEEFKVACPQYYRAYIKHLDLLKRLFINPEDEITVNNVTPVPEGKQLLVKVKGDALYLAYYRGGIFISNEGKILDPEVWVDLESVSNLKFIMKR